MLDFSSFERAVKSLQKALTRALGAKDDEELRDAVIQRFEYTFELSWKMLKRVIESEAAVPSQIDQLSFKDLIREAAEKGLLQDVEKWMVYREQRNITSHAYDQKKAESVFKTAIEFANSSEKLLNVLKARKK